MNTKGRRTTFLWTITFILAIAILTFSMTEAKAQRLEVLPQGVETLLSDYSQYIETGTTSKKANYSSQMDLLITERREYYREFFEKGLHSDFISLEAEFLTDQGMEITREGDTYYVFLFERVAMYGTPLTTSPEKYPLIQAAKWALGQTDDEGIKQELNQYIESTTSGVNESVKDGVEIVFIINHKIEITIEKDQLQIGRDTFTDKAIDNPDGFDNVNWSNGTFTREKPTWDTMLDYVIYHTPIETLGKNLLDDFQPSANKPEESPLVVIYNRTNAKSYVLAYSSNPNEVWIPECNANLRRNTSYWNPSYSFVWNANATIRCNDCADFVSQAIKFGGIPQDGTWFPAWNNYSWVNVNGLRDYMISTYDGIYLVSKSALQIGEPVIIPGTHIAMATTINPYRVSGHTNDRNNYPMSSSYTQFLHISSTP